MHPSFWHVATFGHHEVYVGERTDWAVKSGAHWCDTPALQAQASLLWLPLLKHDYPTVRAALVTGLTQASPEQVVDRLTTFPVEHLLRLALTSGSSGYWVNLALEWASQVELDPDVRRAVRTLALDPLVPQPTRHRAKRLYYTGKA
jgi:hypothetical protein